MKFSWSMLYKELTTNFSLRAINYICLTERNCRLN